MLKSLLLLSPKLKFILFILLFMAPLGVAIYFIYDSFIKDDTEEQEIMRIAYYYKPSHEGNNKNLYQLSDQSIPKDENKNLTFVRCSTNLDLYPDLDNYWCSILTKDYYGNEVAILKINFQNVTEYFGQCLYNPTTYVNNPAALSCDFPDSTSGKNDWFKEVVLKNSNNFTIDLYKTMRFGPELVLINEFVIQRGKEERKKPSLSLNKGEYVNNNIIAYISDSIDPEIQTANYYNAIAKIKNNTGNYERDQISLKQSLIRAYAEHIITFNKYDGRNKRFDITSDKSDNPLHSFFTLLSTQIKNAFSGQNGNDNYDKFKRLLILANKNKDNILFEERKEAISIFQAANWQTNNEERTNKLLSSLLSSDEHQFYFNSCESNLTFPYKNLNDIQFLTDTAPSGDQEALYLRIRKWFNINTLLSELYVILTMPSLASASSSCPNLADDKYNYLNYYLSLKLFGFDPLLNLSTIQKISNLVFYNIWNWNDKLSLPDIEENEGILLTANVDENEIDNTIPLNQISKMENTVLFKKGNVYYMLAFLFGKNPLPNSDKVANKYSFYIGTQGLGIHLLPFDWDNIAFKRTGLLNQGNNYTHLKNEVGAFIASFTITKGKRRQLIQDNQKYFMFVDNYSPGLYLSGEKQTYLTLFPAFDGDI